jgi:phosphatidylserine decarboxylase
MIVKDAFRFLIPLIISAGLALFLGLTVAAVLVLLLAVFVALFFRNPKRDIPSDPDVIVAPADGRIVRIERVGNVTRVSIFLSLFNVHVNRSPIAGRIEAIDYKPGKFKMALNHAASVENERNVIMVTQGDVKLVFTQIAGMIARRIVCWKRVGDAVGKGELIGLIRFGSRVDILFPAGTEVTAKRGDRVRGGSSAIGVIKKTS